jgi:hypothetical protein
LPTLQALKSPELSWMHWSGVFPEPAPAVLGAATTPAVASASVAVTMILLIPVLFMISSVGGLAALGAVNRLGGADYRPIEAVESGIGGARARVTVQP